MAKRRRKKLSKELITTTITGLNHEGKGIAHIDGKTTFVALALPEEVVDIQYTNCYSKYNEAKVVAVQKPHPQRIDAKCQHFEMCGGCSLQHIDSKKQIINKQQTLLEQLTHFGQVTPETVLPPLTGPHWGYRHKARLGIKYVAQKNKVLVGFRERYSRFVADIDHCEVLHPQVAELIAPLSEVLLGMEAKASIPQVEVAVGEDAIALIFRHLNPLSEHDSNCLLEFSKRAGTRLYLQPKGPDTVHLVYPEQDNDLLHYSLPQYQLNYEFHPCEFTQINPHINQHMVAQALELLQIQPDDKILDLFCGLGNFTLPMAQFAKQVTGVEGSEAMVKRAQTNAQNNGLRNVEFYAADLTKNLTKLPWFCQQYDKLLLDPPRSGALEFIQQFPHLGAKRIVYVSCNPATLARDAGELVNQQGYRLTAVGVMDMFPQTSHVESIALFEKG